MRRLVLLALVAPLVLGGQAPSDTSRPRTTFVRLRVLDAPSFWRPVELMAPIGDTVVVKGTYSRYDTVKVYRFPLRSVSRIEYPFPRSRGEGALHGAKVGGLVGFFIGAVLTTPALVEGACNRDGSCFGPLIFAFGTATFSSAGALIGALVGRISPGVDWLCVQNAPCRK